MLLQQNIWNDKNLIKMLTEDGVVVMPTDTLYGIVGKALNVSVVNRIFKVRKRNPEKPCIILIGDISELEKFSINISEAQKNIIKEFTEPVSFVLDCKDNLKNETLAYLHRGTKTLAFRLPARNASRSDAGGPALGELRDLLLKTGPLIAPSANLEGLPPAQNILEAKKYFGDLIDLYVDEGEIKGKASRIIKLHKDGSVEVLRN